MQEVGQKSHNSIPNTRIRTNKSSKVQTTKTLQLSNQHIVSVLQPFELKNLLTHA